MAGGWRPWRPKDGLEMAAFAREWCHRCAFEGLIGRPCRLKGLAAAHRIGHPHYPREFRMDECGRPDCARFVEVGTEAAAYADDRQDALCL